MAFLGLIGQSQQVPGHLPTLPTLTMRLLKAFAFVRVHTDGKPSISHVLAAPPSSAHERIHWVSITSQKQSCRPQRPTSPSVRRNVSHISPDCSIFPAHHEATSHWTVLGRKIFLDGDLEDLDTDRRNLRHHSNAIRVSLQQSHVILLPCFVLVRGSLYAVLYSTKAKNTACPSSLPVCFLAILKFLLQLRSFLKAIGFACTR